MKSTIHDQIRTGNRMFSAASFLGWLLALFVISGFTTNITLVEPDAAVDRLYFSSRLPESYTYYYVGTDR